MGDSSSEISVDRYIYKASANVFNIPQLNIVKIFELIWSDLEFEPFLANDWFVEKIVVRESSHAPYQFVFAESRVVDSDKPGMIRKHLILTGSLGSLCQVPPGLECLKLIQKLMDWH